MKFLLLLFLIFIFVFVFLGSILRGIIRFFLPSNKQGGAFNRNGNRQNSSHAEPPEEKKVFSEKEGEYVSYEEVKEEQ